MVGRTLGRYRILSKIGQGGMATVWKAEDGLLERVVALKILSDELAHSAEACRRFLNEGRTAERLHHPGIVPVFTAEQSDGIIYLTMAFVDGETLAERLTHGPLDWRDASRVVRDAARALAYAHQQDVIHRDVSCRNIMLGRDDRVFVLDFGLALALGMSRLTPSFTTLGTVPFIAPEVADGVEASPRSDLYGLGVVFYFALTGALPFDGDRREIVIHLILNRPPLPPRALQPGIPPAVEQIVLRMLAKDPRERHESMDDLIVDLDRILREAPLPGAAEAGAKKGPAAVLEDASTEEIPVLAPPRTPEVRYLLLLPFVHSDDEGIPTEGDTLGRKLADTVGALLGGLPGLFVIPSAPPAEGTEPDDDVRMARRAGANLILKGSLHREHSRVRVSFSVLDPYRGAQIGAGVVDEAAESLFLVEDRVASAVRALLGYGADEVPTRTPRGNDPVAREHYLQALGYLRRYENEASVDGAIAILESLARTEEGQTGAVHASLGRAYLYKYRLTRHRMWEAKAADACERAVKLDPEAPEALLVLGDARMEMGRWDEAVADYQRALSLAPDLIEAHLGLARAQEARGDLAAAAATCEEAVRRWPDDWRCHSRLGLFHYARGQFEDAARSWRRLVEIAPDNCRGLLQLGSAYFHLDRLEDAEEVFRRSAEILPTASALSNLGTVLFYLGRFAESIEALERATQLRPLDPLVWGHLGSALTWTPGCRERAPAALERGIELMRSRLERNPNEAEDWAFLGSWLANLGRYEEARQAIQRALTLAPQNVRVMARVGVTCEHIGDRSRAILLLRTAVERGHDIGILVREPTLHRLRESPLFQEIVSAAREAGRDVHTKPIGGEAA